MRNYKSEYQWAVIQIDRILVANHLGPVEINSVAEIGSRDALDGIYLSKIYSAHTYVFEPDPSNADICRINIDRFGSSDISFYELALLDKDEAIEFYSVDKALYDNNGAGGLFKINFHHRFKGDPDYKRGPVQRRITVAGARFDTLGIPPPSHCYGRSGRRALGFKGIWAFIESREGYYP